MKTIWIGAAALIAAASLASAETKSGQKETVAIGGKTIGIAYSAPAVNNRVGKLFGKDGQVGKDETYPVWRAGANNATVLHTDAALDLGGLAVPSGDYSLYIDVANPASWVLIVNKQTGQPGTEYDAKQDLGSVKMTMSKPPAMVEQLKYTLSAAGGKKGKLQLTWEHVAASVNFTAK